MQSKPLLKKPDTTLLSPRMIDEEIKEPYTIKVKAEPSSLKRSPEVNPKRDLLMITKTSASPASRTITNKNNGQNK